MCIKLIAISMVVMIFHILVTHVLISEHLLSSQLPQINQVWPLQHEKLELGRVEPQNVCHNSLNNLLISWKRFNSRLQILINFKIQHFMITASLGATLLWAGHRLDVGHLLLVEDAGHQDTTTRGEAEEPTAVHLPALGLAVLPLIHHTAIKTRWHGHMMIWSLSHVLSLKEVPIPISKSGYYRLKVYLKILSYI